MLEATLVAQDSFVDSLGSHERTIRFRYSTTDGSGLHFVIVDIDCDGHEEWAEQEAGELAWFPYVPTNNDRRLIESWKESGGQPSGWPLLVVPSKRRR